MVKEIVFFCFERPLNPQKEMYLYPPHLGYLELTSPFCSDFYLKVTPLADSFKGLHVLSVVLKVKLLELGTSL